MCPSGTAPGPDAGGDCSECRAERHRWGQPQTETFRLGDGYVVRLHRLSCICTSCLMRCIARVVYVEIEDEEPTVELPPVQGSAQGTLPVREPGTNLHPTLNQPRPVGSSGVPQPQEPLARLDKHTMNKLVRGIERL